MVYEDIRYIITSQINKLFLLDQYNNLSNWDIAFDYNCHIYTNIGVCDKSTGLPYRVIT